MHAIIPGTYRDRSIQGTLLHWPPIVTKEEWGTAFTVFKPSRNAPGGTILEFVLEREPGSGSIQFSAYGYIAPTRRLACVSSMTCARSKG